MEIDFAKLGIKLINLKGTESNSHFGKAVSQVLKQAAYGQTDRDCSKPDLEEN